ncbi:hypothetical protein HanPI659440_Chr15g0613971 [Helianthus annuus]|nr:hypothetical protein HanPI659440_Chr15g0613971 [Helianthus annuus]
MTVRETLDFSSRCQGTGSRAGMTDHFMHIKQILHTLYSIPRDDCLRTNSKLVYSRIEIMMEVNRREKEGRKKEGLFQIQIQTHFYEGNFH